MVGELEEGYEEGEEFVVLVREELVQSTLKAVGV